MKRKIIFIISLFFLLASFTNEDFYLRLSSAAITLTEQHVTYDPAYVKIQYPGGDVAPEKGVCTDVVIRAYRKIGIDLQKEVHEDMSRNFSLYPKKYGLKTTDRNIDHRRVPNLMVFFSRKGKSFPVTDLATDYKPGDIVSWNLKSGATHIGIVVNVKSETDSKRYKVVHNVGNGQQLEDCLFNNTITGHYRYQK